MRGIRSFNSISKRCYAARRSGSLTEPLALRIKSAAAPLTPQNVQVSKLPNGLVIASLENYSPMSSVGLFVKAGSRHETVESPGVAHVLRLAANLSTKGSSAFKICRGVEALGGSLSVTSTRETTVYTAQCLRDDIPSLLEYFSHVTTAQEFRPWELDDLTARVKIDKALCNVDPHVGVMEKLHEAAYKNALSHSLYCPDFMVGRVSSKEMHAFVQANFTTGRMALVGLGVNHSVLRQLGEGLLSSRSGPGAPVARAVYRGGEARIHSRDDLVHVLVASESAALGAAQANAFSVLQHVLGAGPHVKRGSNITSKLTQGIAKATSQPFDASAMTASYSDSGLFGVYTISQAAAAGEVIRAAISQVRDVAEGNVADADISRAKNQVKVEYLMSLEDCEGLLQEIGAQALMTGTYQAPDAVLKAVEAVTPEDVIKAAKSFVDGKKTMVASGLLVNTPFVDEL
ncbi:cytochrome b-c1 complex subunit 2, mitochondrial-like [Boleophthalmus pectinirostris]|uniref:cytochrome b-c1 complex subunit 2, mitochondrial-like n=1 Tax=Boleophthalmus pectinirostris TaxID=150288 RepID=UPI00242A9166|nr:cytochrome b-c1 complex subunit 2, mitochondrial-like [Boleophthalmus pectinirostris]